MIKAITFDIGNTLLFPYPSVGELYARSAARCGITVTPEEAETRFLQAWCTVQSRYEPLVFGTTHGEAKRFWFQVLTAFFRESAPGASTIQAIVDDLYHVFSLPDSWRVHSGWSDLRDDCRRRGWRLGLISNWDLRLRDLLRALELLPDFDAVIISAERGVEKPDAAIFRQAVDLLGVAPAECLHLGDTWEDDVVGAFRAGLQPVWFNPARRSRPESTFCCPEVTDLRQLSVGLS